eukprot:6886953-Alexandrium_andersonii.AAC.1
MPEGPVDTPAGAHAQLIEMSRGTPKELNLAVGLGCNISRTRILPEASCSNAISQSNARARVLERV